MTDSVTRITATLLICCSAVMSQTNPPYDLSHNVIASGGGSSSTGGSFSLDGTAGQAAAGTLSSGVGFIHRSGFWAFGSLAPTAARVSISGRVSTAGGLGIDGAILTLAAADGSNRQAITSPFGYFSFQSVEAGQTYVLSVRSKRFTFSEPVRTISVLDSIEDADFTALPQ